MLAMHQPTFCHAHGANGRVAEHNSGDILVHKAGSRLVPKEAVGQGAASSYGNWGQLKLATHIAQSIHVGRCVLELHNNTARL